MLYVLCVFIKWAMPDMIIELLLIQLGIRSAVFSRSIYEWFVMAQAAPTGVDQSADQGRAHDVQGTPVGEPDASSKNEKQKCT